MGGWVGCDKHLVVIELDCVREQSRRCHPAFWDG